MDRQQDSFQTQTIDPQPLLTWFNEELPLHTVPHKKHQNPILALDTEQTAPIRQLHHHQHMVQGGREGGGGGRGGGGENNNMNERTRKQYYPPLPSPFNTNLTSSVSSEKVGSEMSEGQGLSKKHEKPFPMINTFKVEYPYYQHPEPTSTST